MTSRQFAKHMRSAARQEQLDQLSLPIDDAPPSEPPQVDEPTEPAGPTDTPDDPDDLSWAAELSEFKSGLHGLELKELLAALRDGQIPDALLDKLSVELVDGDHRWPATIADARNGAMMRAKFQQVTAEHARAVREWQSERDEFIDYLRGWKDDPDLLLAGLERLGLPFDQAFRKYGQFLQEINAVWEKEQAGELPAGTAKKVFEHNQQQRQIAELNMYKQREEAKQQAVQQAQQSDQIVSLIQQAGAEALASVNIDATNTTYWRIFRRQLTDAYSRNGRLPTRQDIVDAAHATREEIDETIRTHEAKQPKAAPVAPRNVDTPAPNMATSKPRSGQPRAITTKEWARKHLYGYRN